MKKQVVMTATYIESEIDSMVEDCIEKTGYVDMRDELLDIVYALIDPEKDTKISTFRDLNNHKGDDNLYSVSLFDYYIEKLKRETDAIHPIKDEDSIVNAIKKVHEWKLRLLLLYCTQYMESLKIKIQQERY